MSDSGHPNPSRSRDLVTERLLRDLRRHRKALRFTIYDLADRVGVSPSFISLIENGRQVPDAGVAVRLAKALKLDPDRYRAWAEVRRRSRDAMRAMDAAETLKPVLEDERLFGSRTDEIPRPPDPASPKSAAAPLPPPPIPATVQAGRRGVRPPVWSPGGSRLPAGREDEAGRLHQLKIPLVSEGTEPRPAGDTQGRARRPLWLDRRLLPPEDELGELFAWRLTRRGIQRVRAWLQTGDVVVLSRGRPSPTKEATRSRHIYALRTEKAVLLSRVTWSKGFLVLLPNEEEGDFHFLPAATETEMARHLVGRVVAVVRRFPLKPGED